jgi:hypothetical protein
MAGLLDKQGIEKGLFCRHGIRRSRKSCSDNVIEHLHPLNVKALDWLRMSDTTLSTTSTINRLSDPRSWPLWVVEGTIDLPARLPASSTGSQVAQLVVSLGGEDPDGFMQLRPHDRDRLAQMSWWSATERWVYDYRGLVRALDAVSALTRGSELYEHVADRMTLWSGNPVQVLAVCFTYNEDMLRKCAAGELTEYDSTTGGEYTFPVNTHADYVTRARQLIHPEDPS